MLKRLFIVLALLVLCARPAQADFAAGQKAYDAQDWQNAIEQLRPLADKGDARALILLGNMYRSGYGVMLNRAEALKLYKRAAIEKASPQAMNAVGAMYTDGQGTPPDIKTARAWFHRSALLGDQTGAMFAAIIFYEGNNSLYDPLKPDLEKAYKWYKICAMEKQNSTYAAFCGKAAKGLAGKYLKKGRIAALDKEIAAWKPLAPKDLGPPPPDPKPPSPDAVKKRILRMLQHQDKHAVHPKAVLP